MRSALLLACCFVLSAASAAPKQRDQQDQPSCESAREDLERYLGTFSRACRRDSDCEGYYYRADACAPAVVLRKHKLAGKREQRLLARQQRAGEACTLKYRTRPACSSIPFRATCRRRVCVDALAGLPPAEPASRPPTAFPFATIRHACGPTDGPALQITLTQVADPGPDDARLFLSLYHDLPEVPMSQPHTFQLTHMQEGDGALCLRPHACQTAERGTVVLQKLDGRSAEGNYELFFQDGSSQRGTFKASWKEVRQDCG